MSAQRRHRLIVLAILFALVYAALGLYAVYFHSATVEASTPRDAACMRYERKHHVPLPKARRRCTIHLVVISSGGGGKGKSAEAGGGFNKWTVGNFFWSFTNTLQWRYEMVSNGVQDVQTVYVDSILCNINHAWVVGLSISQCGWWYLYPSSDGKYSGAYFTTSFGPVTEGWQSVEVLYNDGRTVPPVDKRPCREPC
jgi:hypothetical protein